MVENPFFDGSDEDGDDDSEMDGAVGGSKGLVIKREAEDQEAKEEALRKAEAEEAALSNAKKGVEASLEEARTAWIFGCLQMLSGKQSWEHDKEKETPANDNVATFSIEEVSTKAGSAYFVEKLMSGGEAIRTDILDELLSMDIEQLACDPNSSKVVQAAVLAMKNHPNHASQLIANLASNLPKLATHPHGYLPLLSAFNAADLKQQGEFTTWLENEAVLLKLLNIDFGAFVLCQMMGEMTPGQTASLQVCFILLVLFDNLNCN